MNIKRLLTLFIMLCLLYFSSTVAMAAGGVTDVTAPVVTDFTIDKNGETLKGGDTFTFSCSVEEESSVDRIDVVFRNLTADISFGDFSTVARASDSTLKYNSTTGRYDITITLPAEIKNAKWNLHLISTFDNHINFSHTFYNSDICFYVSEGSSDATPPVVSDISIDYSGLELPPNNSIILSFKAEDESAIESINVEFIYKTDNSNRPVFSASRQAGSLVYNNLAGKYEAKFSIPYNYNVYPGKWSLFGLSVSDKYNNAFYFDNCDSVWNIELNEYIHTIKNNIFFLMPGTTADTTPPVVSDININKNGETLACGDSFILSFKAEDESDIKSAYVRFENIDYHSSNVSQHYAYVHDRSLLYNNTTGKYEILFTIPNTMIIGEWSLDDLNVYDANGCISYNNNILQRAYDATLDETSYTFKQNLTFKVLDDTNITAFNIVENAAPNTSVVINLANQTLIPKNAFMLAKANNIVMNFTSSDNSYTWTIKGTDIQAISGAVNLGVVLNSSNIPSNVTNTITGAKGTKQVSLSHDGPFGFIGALAFNTFSENAGDYANLYHYDNGALEFKASEKISPDGSVTFMFSHASDYLIVLSNNDLDPSVVPSTYTISTVVDGNGIISPGGNITVNRNGNQSIQISTTSGYKISDVKVDGVSVGALSTYVFENVTASHTIQAFFIPIPPSNNNPDGGGGGYYGGGGFGGGGGGAPAPSVTPTPIVPEVTIEKNTQVSSNKDWEDFVSRLSKSDSDIKELNITLDGTGIIPQAAIQQIQDKNIDLNIKLENGITWIIKGSSITNSSMGDIDLDIVTNANDISSRLLPTDTKDESSIQLSLKHDGNFGFEADVIVPVTVEDAGKIATLYYYNPVNGKFEYMSSNKVSSDGTISIHFSHASDYVVVIGNQLHIDPSLLKEISLNTDKETLYLGGTEVTNKLSVILPPSLTTAIANGYADYSVTYSSSKSSVASVSSSGVITAKSIGKATIITTVSIGDTTTSFKTDINVKKANFRFLSYENNMKIGNSVSFSFKANGYDISEISWYTTEKNIVNVGKNKGKLKATVTAVSAGTDYLVIKFIDTKGKVYTEKIKIVVK